jgi:tRNA-dihydrouridine synthase
MLASKTFRQYVKAKRKLAPMFHTEAGDLPTIIQISGNDPDIVLEAALLAQPYCVGIDLNLGISKSNICFF